MRNQVDMTPPMRVYYDNEGNIVSIGPGDYEGYSYFETTYEAVADLMTLKDDPMNYVVRFDSTTGKHTLVSIKNADEKEYKLTELVKYNGSFYSLLLSINEGSNTAILICDDVIKNKLNVSEFVFYFTKKNNPSVLYKTIKFNINETVEETIFSNMENVSIYTVRNLEKLCYEVK